MTQDRRTEPYALEMSPTELDRLMRLSQVYEQEVRDGFWRLGLQAGSKVIDVGCGAAGALLVLSEIVGPRGTVVGLDMNETSLRRARQMLDQRGYGHVGLVHANVNEMPASAVCPPGPFDAAYCRLFLTWQSNPAETLRRIASILRPGGHIVAHEPLIVPRVPRSLPEVPAIDINWEWLLQILQRLGGSPDIPRRYLTLCREAGLTEVTQRGFFSCDVAQASLRISIEHDSVLAGRAAIEKLGIASAEQVDSVLGQFKEAQAWEFQALFTGLYVELVARVA